MVNMWRFILLGLAFELVYVLCTEETEGIRIPLFRQKTPREAALNSKNLERFGIDIKSLHKHHKHNSTNGTDSIALFRFLDTEFYGKVQVGTKGQTLNLVFDTAWQTSWVLSNDCSWETIGCWFHNKYDHTVSSTYIADNRKYIVEEGTYNLTGYYSNDTMVLGHSRVYNQSFVEMVSVPYTYLFSKTDGVMGLGFKTDKYEPFFYNLLRNGTVKKPLFSIYLNRDRQSHRGGNVLLGFIDTKHIHQMPGPDNKTIPEKITYLPVDGSGGHWQFRMDRVLLNLPAQKKTLAFCVSGCNAIADTSSNTIVGPQADIKRIHTQMKAKYLPFGRYRVNCDTVNKLPPIDFILAGKNFTIDGNHYIQRMSVGSLTFCVSAFIGNDAPSEQNLWVLGGGFLSHFYSIYDIANNQIGLVRAA